MEETRTSVIRVRTTEGQMSTYKEAAEACSMGLSEWVRTSLDGAAEVDLREDEIFPKWLREIFSPKEEELVVKRAKDYSTSVAVWLRDFVLKQLHERHKSSVT